MQNNELPSILSEASLPVENGCPFHRTPGPIRTAVPSNPAPFKGAGTFVSLSKFVVANEKTIEVKEAFRSRPHLVDGQPGFVRMEVFSPLDRPEEIWLITYWADAESFHLWHRSHLYQESHKGIPRHLKLVSGETEMRHFEYICS
jgi:heme-degrading monooxygenase HmoA